jgi:hypothetical protein
MSERPETIIAASFFDIHSIITRGLKVALTGTRSALQDSFQGESAREGLFNYIRSLTSVLNAHHHTEDEIAFPYFRPKLPEVNFDSWTIWHQKLVRILEEINLAVEKCAKDDQLEFELGKIKSNLARLKEMWPYHMGPETDDFINKADALVPVEEGIRLVGLFADYMLKLATPTSLTVPFMLYNLPGQYRQPFSLWMPEDMVQILVPGVWKEIWASMAPYLLT